MKKNRLFGVCLTMLILITVKAFAEVTDVEKDIYSLEYIGLQVHWIENESSFLLWQYRNPKDYDKDAVDSVIESADRRLSEVKKSLMKLALGADAGVLREEFAGVIDHLRKFYLGAKGKSDEDLNAEFEEVWDHVGEYNTKFKDFIGKNLNLPDPGKPFDMLTEELKFFSTEEDKESYARAVQLIGEEKYKEANEILQDLLGYHFDDVAEGIIAEKIVICYETFNSPLRDEGYPDYSINLLTTVLFKESYHPNLYILFRQWRQLYQKSNHGMSNWSIIPNELYIKKRMSMVRIIEEYVAEHPDDMWAEYQIPIIMDLPIIERGHSYGNSILNETAYLFMNREDQQNEGGEE